VRTLCALLQARFASNPALASRFPRCPAAGGRAVAELIAYVTDRPGHDWRYAIDASRIEAELGFSPAHTFETGIAATIDWYLSNEAWWRALLAPRA
jgi:dTDP-glucose 4,6-dehydratase